jgi:hypothetical protein
VSLNKPINLNQKRRRGLPPNLPCFEDEQTGGREKTKFGWQHSTSVAWSESTASSLPMLRTGVRNQQRCPELAIKMGGNSARLLAHHERRHRSALSSWRSRARQ